jgi:hypothetical protein
MIELGDLLKKIGAMQAAAKGRLTSQTSEQMRVYVQGFCDGLDGVTATIKKAIEAERTRQRLARLESELAQEVEPDWSQVPGTESKSADQLGNAHPHSISGGMERG